LTSNFELKKAVFSSIIKKILELSYFSQKDI
jgi:hypothetical protein